MRQPGQLLRRLVQQEPLLTRWHRSLERQQGLQCWVGEAAWRRLGVPQVMQQSNKVAQQRLRQQRLELQWHKAGAQLRRQAQRQHRQPGREVATLQMRRRLLGRLQEQ